MNTLKALHFLALALACRPLFALAQPVRRQSGGPVDQIRRMPQDQRRRTLETLPPDRRKQAEMRMQKLDALPAEEREALQKRYEAFQKLPSEHQQRARDMFQQFNALDDNRRAKVQTEMDSLRTMSQVERSDRLKSQQFKKKFNRNEQSILSGYSALLDETP